mmetsp:Transcript_15749/g.36574  ORF Transcript_15749/g.36574 Transcript_15749/m.36574 type:complete len:98 (-) Transcript_15749:67-360(-)
MGGVGCLKRTCKGLFTEFAKQLPELDPESPAHAGALWYQQGTIADFMLDAMSLDLSKVVAKTPGGHTLADMKALAPGTRNSESTSAAPSHAIKKRQE